MPSDFPEELDVVEVGQPILVVGGEAGLAVEAHESVELRAEQLGVRVDGLVGYHLAHLALARRVAYPRGSSAEQRYADMPGVPQVPEREKGYHVADVQGRSCRIATDVEGHGSRVHQGGKPLDVGALLDKATFLQGLQSAIHIVPPSCCAG